MNEDGENRYHLLPMNDIKPHVERGEWCNCSPEITRDGIHTFVIHNAYDGREFYEEESEVGA